MIENIRKINLLIDCLSDEEVHYINILVKSNEFRESLILTFYTEGFDISLIN